MPKPIDEAAIDGTATDEAATDGAALDGTATDEAATDEAATDEAATDEAAIDGAATDGATIDGASFAKQTQKRAPLLLIDRQEAAPLFWYPNLSFPHRFRALSAPSPHAVDMPLEVAAPNELGEHMLREDRYSA